MGDEKARKVVCVSRPEDFFPWLLLMERSSHSVDFRVVVSTAANDEGYFFGDDFGGLDPWDAVPKISGTVKWDGCSHVYFGDPVKGVSGVGHDGYLHVCGLDNWETLPYALARIPRACLDFLSEAGTYIDEDPKDMPEARAWPVVADGASVPEGGTT